MGVGSSPVPSPPPVGVTDAVGAPPSRDTKYSMHGSSGRLSNRNSNCACSSAVSSMRRHSWHCCSHRNESCAAADHGKPACAVRSASAVANVFWLITYLPRIGFGMVLVQPKVQVCKHSRSCFNGWASNWPPAKFQTIIIQFSTHSVRSMYFFT